MKKTLFFIILLVAMVAISSCEKQEVTNHPEQTELKDEGVPIETLTYCMTVEEKQVVYDLLGIDESDEGIMVGTCRHCGCITTRVPGGIAPQWRCSNENCPEGGCTKLDWCPPAGSE